MAPTQLPSKFASKQVNLEFMHGLEVMENQVYPLQGAVQRRVDRDPRLKTYVGAGGGDTICLYEHMITVRHRPTGTYYIVFRQTKDAQLLEQSDPVKHPKWLMEHPVKDDELKVYIHMAKANAPQLLSSGVSSIDEWLDEIQNTSTFDTIAYFLLRSGLFTEKMYGSFR